MNKEEVKMVIGEDNWEDFISWFAFQNFTVEKDGTARYEDWHVKDFIRILDGI